MESEVNVLMESVKFMLLGMGVVLIFLSLLIVVVKLQAKIIGKYFPDVDPQTSTSTNQTNNNDEPQRVAAIIAAIASFRKNN
jgi:oxaloacetate decarboxylase gamma subunit